MKPVSPALLAESGAGPRGPGVVRPIHPDDQAMMVHFHEGLSTGASTSATSTWMTLARARRTSADPVSVRRLRPRVCPVAEGRERRKAARRPSWEWRACQRVGDGEAAEFALVVATAIRGDRRRRGADAAVDRIARQEGVSRLRADILSDNGAMRRLCARAGIPVRPTTDRSLSKPISSCESAEPRTARERPPTQSYTGAIAPAFTVSPPPFVSSTSSHAWALA